MSIALDQVTKRYQSVPVVNDVSLKVEQGEFLVLLGPSGSGKSTVGLCLAGLAPASIPAAVSGEVRLDGEDAAALSVGERTARIAAVVAIIAFFDVPIVHMAITWWGSIVHPKKVVLEPLMRHTEFVSWIGMLGWNHSGIDWLAEIPEFRLYGTPGSYDGDDTSASSFPVTGSRAATLSQTRPSMSPVRSRSLTLR